MKLNQESQRTTYAKLAESRKALIESLPAAYSQSTVLQIRRALGNPLFPFTFLLRNVMALDREPNWHQRPVDLKRSDLLRLLEERSAVFCEVMDWLITRGEDRERVAATVIESSRRRDLSSYCTHCGGCCEIASGLPEFPAGVKIPPAWKNLFGVGLGPWQRFCPFLWEAHGKGLSLCAIHEWRPNPCRSFAEDECRYLMADIDFSSLQDPGRLLATGRGLSRLVEGGELPS